MWNRKNKFERDLDSLESNAAVAVGHMADSIREKLGNESGEQVAHALHALADKVDALDLADQVQRSRKEIEKASKKARKQVERGRKEIATLSAKTVPEEPINWVGPTVFGFLLGFGAGFLAAKATSRKPERA